MAPTRPVPQAPQARLAPPVPQAQEPPLRRQPTSRRAVASLAAKKSQRFGRTVNLTVAATSEDLWVSASGRLAIRGTTKAYRLKVKDRFVARGSKLTLKLVLPVAARKAVRQALDHGRQVRMTLTVRVPGPGGQPLR